MRSRRSLLRIYWVTGLIGGLFIAPPEYAQAQVRELTLYEKTCQSWINKKGKVSEPQRLKAIFDFQWKHWMVTYPEWATSVGYPGQNDRWTDSSPSALARERTNEKCFFRLAKSIDLNKLRAGDRLNAELFQYDARQKEMRQNFPVEQLGLNQLSGPHQDGPQLFRSAPKANFKDIENILMRLRTADRRIDQMMNLLQEGIRNKVTAPRVVLAKIPDQIQAMIKEDPFASPWLRFLDELPANLTPEQVIQIRSEASKIYVESLKPKLEKFKKFVVEIYLPSAREGIAWTELPNGSAWYKYRLTGMTTTNLSASEIHQIGLSEVSRIEGEIKKVAAELRFSQETSALAKKLRSEKQYLFTDKESFLSAYRDIAKRIDAELPKFFGKLPRLTYGILPVPDYAEKSPPAADYFEGSGEAGRAGFFYANTYNLPGRPRWEMESLCLHEAVPGHHMQISLQQELEGAPEFRKHSGFTAYSEGWGLYAETLGYEMGFYKTPADRFGQLTNEMWRAVRLVVDTGIHEIGWDRNKAIQYMIDKTGKDPHEAEVEIDRYIVWAGQATAYKIGQLKFKELRERGERELGPKFNLRQFHDAVLANGALPLEVLDQQFNLFIKKQKGH